jgi:hypothetical protein
MSVACFARVRGMADQGDYLSLDARAVLDPPPDHATATVAARLARLQNGCRFENTEIRPIAEPHDVR